MTSTSDGRLSSLPTRALPGGLVLHDAATVAARGRGLAGLSALPRGHALLIAPCRSVHTFGMRFTLDLVWLGSGGRVVRVDTAVRAGRLRTCLRARRVVECNAGEGERFAAALGAATR